MLPLTRSRGRQRFFGGGWNPFSQLGPTLDLSFAGVVTDLTDPNGYTLNTNFIAPQYQIAAQYVVWETNVGLVDKTFSQIITFTRASTATYFDSAGVLTSAAIDAPRLDYNPSTLAAQGLLIEEARTNSIRNNTAQGAVAGTPGTAPTNWAATTTGGVFTRTIVGTGTENGITYFEVRYQFSGAGTATVQYEQGMQIAASNGQTWTQSAYVKLAGGSLTNISEVRNGISENDSGGTFLAGNTTAFTPTSSALSGQRYTHIRTLNNASTAFVVSTTQIVSSGAADITLRIGLPQLEQGAFATSVIPTTTTALTRAADVASVNTLSPWFNATEGTLYAEFTASSNANTAYAALSNGTIAQNSVYFDNDGGVLRNVTFSSSSAQAAMSTGAIGTVGAVNKVAGGYKVNDFAVSRNGGSVVTDTLGAVPLSISQLDIGRNPNAVASTYVSGYLRRITYYPRRLSNAELQTITT